jgi:hypothetical protein
MLKLGEQRFTRGRSKFSDHLPDFREPTAKVYVKIRFGGLDHTTLAQVDTGAAWSVLPPDLAKAAQVEAEAGEPTKLSTRMGIKTGFLLRAPFVLVAEEGESLETEGTFFVPSDWPLGLSFLGYAGLLDSIRFALDPQANDFYFGPPAGRS